MHRISAVHQYLIGVSGSFIVVVSCIDAVPSELWKGSHCWILIFVFKKASSPSWASYQIRKIAGCACVGNAGNVFPRRRFQMKPLVSDLGMHHGTCVTHVP